MRLGHSLVLAWSLCLCALSACGTDGETPVCTDFPAPYDVTDEADRSAAREAIAAAAAEGCLTAPATFDDGASGAGGADDGGAGAAAGDAGSTAEAGASGASP